MPVRRLSLEAVLEVCLPSMLLHFLGIWSQHGWWGDPVKEGRKGLNIDWRTLNASPILK